MLFLNPIPVRRSPAAIHELLLRVESAESQWCDCGKRQTRHHLVIECRAWAPHIRELWRRIGRDYGWEHPRAPSARWLWGEGATGAVLEFLEDRRVGCWSSAKERLGPQEGED